VHTTLGVCALVRERSYDQAKDRTSLGEAIEVTSMMVSGRAVATALCALGTTSAFTAPVAGFRAAKGVSRQVTRNVGRNLQMATVAEAYDIKVKGEENTMDYRAFFNQA
ncbi:unnamed protein product, partial [Ectocarpus sp. 4 AP-2014]